MGNCHPSKTNVNLGFASVDTGFLGVTISNITLSCRQYLYNMLKVCLQQTESYIMRNVIRKNRVDSKISLASKFQLHCLACTFLTLLQTFCVWTALFSIHLTLSLYKGHFGLDITSILVNLLPRCPRHLHASDMTLLLFMFKQIIFYLYRPCTLHDIKTSL